jgi:tetratricopeptide (TPR) repeat protein
MLIGADFYLSHRIYVATSQHKLYFTYNGGPVFNLTSSPSTKAATDPAADEPSDAAGFSRRGAAFAARHDYQHAIADFTRACELAPGEADYFYQRGIARWQNEQPDLAAEDFDQALKLKPDDVSALMARAELRLRGKDNAGASTDLDAVDRVSAKEADIRFTLARDYVRADLLPQSVVQYDLWIASHSDDSKLVMALNDRCWLRALSGQDLGDALADCNAALNRSPKDGPINAQIFNSRGMVRLRMGDFDRSIADYDAAIKLQPKYAWAVYGRGLAKLRRGKNSEGQSDIAAAIALRPRIADELKKRGIAP